MADQLVEPVQEQMAELGQCLHILAARNTAVAVAAVAEQPMP